MARKGLGRGLGALLSGPSTEEIQAQGNSPPAGMNINGSDGSGSTGLTGSGPSGTGLSGTALSGTGPSGGGGARYVDIRKIEPNRDQPRQYFDEASLEELADSIRAFGIIQPLILKDCGDYYSIIAGERRFRAARLANLDSIPAIVKEYTELESLQIALIENIQREDLTPIEEALCYKRLMDDFFFSQEDVAGKVGKSRVAISNAVRLLDLDSRVQEMISFGQLTASHAKGLLTVIEADAQFEIAEQISSESLSVRAAESLIAAKLKEAEKAKDIDEPTDLEDSDIYEQQKQNEQNEQNQIAAFRQVEEELKSVLGAKVSIMQGKKKGKIEIEYYSPEELDRLLGILKGEQV